MPAHEVIDPKEFAQIASRFAGLPVARPWLGDYTALYLEIGSLTGRYQHSGRPKAALCAYVGFDWVLSSPSGHAITSAAAGSAAQAVVALEGAQVVGVRLAPALALAIDLAAGSCLQSLSDPKDDQHWTLYLSDGLCISVRSGEIISEESTPSAQRSRRPTGRRASTR